MGKSYLELTYDITEEEYQELLASQDGKCYGCGRPPGRIRLSVDHKHQRYEKRVSPQSRRPLVRGLLCHTCNNILGRVRDNPITLRRLADYLDNPPAEKIIKPKELTEEQQKLKPVRKKVYRSRSKTTRRSSKGVQNTN